MEWKLDFQEYWTQISVIVVKIFLHKFLRSLDLIEKLIFNFVLMHRKGHTQGSEVDSETRKEILANKNTYLNICFSKTIFDK